MTSCGVVEGIGLLMRNWDYMNTSNSFKSDNMGWWRWSRSKQQIAVTFLAFVTLYSIVRFSFDPSDQFFLCCPEGVNHVNCLGPGPDRLKHHACKQKYPKFQAYFDIEAGKYGTCWSAFNYTSGRSKFKSVDKMIYNELFIKKCKDGFMRAFVNIQNDREILSQNCSSCAIVFSSGRLLGASEL